MSSSPDIEATVSKFVEQIGGEGIIVGLSGGADSIALLAALKSSGARCIAAHCNFGLRGEESERDMAHAIKVSESMNVQCITVRFDVAAYIAEHGGSTETACRELRYDWFEKKRIEHGCDWIAVAHHREDNNETLMLNLLRGTGITGLRGMKQINGRIIRPLLTTTRNQIEDYLEQRGLSYVTDSTNLESEFARNKVRNIIMPTVRGCFPNCDRSIAVTIGNMAEADSFIDEMIAAERSRLVDEHGTIDLATLVATRSSCAFILYELLRPEGFNGSQTAEILRAFAEKVSGKVFTATTGASRILDRDKLIADRGDTAEIRVDIATVDISQFSPGTDKMCEFFSTDVLDGEPLTMRPWHPGDRMRPYGMKGTRLISDIFSDAKLSLPQKAAARLLVKGEQVLWIIGMRRSAAYPVDRSTSKIVRISASKYPGSEQQV